VLSDAPGDRCADRSAVGRAAAAARHRDEGRRRSCAGSRCGSVGGPSAARRACVR